MTEESRAGDLVTWIWTAILRLDLEHHRENARPRLLARSCLVLCALLLRVNNAHRRGDMLPTDNVEVFSPYEHSIAAGTRSIFIKTQQYLRPDLSVSVYSAVPAVAMRGILLSS